MIDIIDKFTKPDDLVVDPCAGSLSIGMACILLSKYGIVIGCGNDDSCLDNSTTPIFALFSRQLLNPNSVIDVTDHDRLHATVLIGITNITGCNWGQTNNGRKGYSRWSSHGADFTAISAPLHFTDRRLCKTIQSLYPNTVGKCKLSWNLSWWNYQVGNACNGMRFFATDRSAINYQT